MNPFRKIFGGAATTTQIQSLKLFQLHEHLSILGDGVQRFEPDNALITACLKAAKSTWSFTGLSSWHSRRREVHHCYESGDKHWGLIHINADHVNCFFIVIVEKASSTPAGYILFDIGSEYSEPLFICPAIGYEGPATEDLIDSTIPNLVSHKDPFALIDVGNGTYMQAYQETDKTFILEHQLVNTSNHYRSLAKFEAQQVITAFKSYAFGKKEWATEIKWEKIDL